MKFSIIQKLLLFFLIISNLFSFLTIPQQPLFYNLKLLIFVLFTIYLTLTFKRGKINVAKSNKYIFISILMQYGLLGILGMFLFIIVTIKGILSINNFKLKSLAFATIISWLAFSLLESSFYSTGNLTSIYIWSELGILISSNKNLNFKSATN